MFERPPFSLKGLNPGVLGTPLKKGAYLLSVYESVWKLQVLSN
jgi:hypothetical protein